MKWLARMLFPRHNHDLRRKEMRALTAAFWVALIVAVIVGILMFYTNNKHHG